MSAWRIRKERVYDRDLGRMSRHLGWSLYFRGNRVARYLTWQSCIDHICKVGEPPGEVRS
jgi:hypothetical protein